LQFIKDMFVKDKSVVSRETFSEGVSMGSSMLFGVGKVSMLHTDFSFSRTLPAGLDWDIVAPPEKTGGEKYFHGGYWGYAILNKSHEKSLAWEFIKFMTSEKALEYALAGMKEGKWAIMGSPSRLRMLQKWVDFYPDKNIKSYLYCLNYPEFRLAQPYGTAAMSETMSKYDLQNVLMSSEKEKDLKQMLDNIAIDYNKLIKEK